MLFTQVLRRGQKGARAPFETRVYRPGVGSRVDHTDRATKHRVITNTSVLEYTFLTRFLFVSSGSRVLLIAQGSVLAFHYRDTARFRAATTATFPSRRYEIRLFFVCVCFSLVHTRCFASYVIFCNRFFDLFRAIDLCLQTISKVIIIYSISYRFVIDDINLKSNSIKVIFR